MWLGVIYDSQATNRKHGGLPMRTPPQRTAIVLLGVIYDSQPARIHKTHHIQLDALTSRLKNRPKLLFKNKNL
jgi:hypothetical protein